MIKMYVPNLQVTWSEQLRKYEAYEKQMNGRNSCLKTDPDAVFMRMKEDTVCRTDN
ncbi:MAG: hypothetical protein M9949_02225 [Candidatus Kapabacteria bacterium]|nr:hypothetical protein [Candidatus Kapabacteria bacterium]